MRGAREALKRRARRSGIIPAYAGSTWRGRLARRRTRDHPRVCGEHDQWGSLTEHRMGSSPRMRGAQGQKTGGGSRPGSSPRMRGAPPPEPRQALPARGIIPAYAGSTWSRSAPTRGGWDHPRVCGEHFLHANRRASRQGSSPRMRGAPRHAPVASDAVGIIPAYAGSTAPSFLKVSQYRDHPRVCGEH